MKTLLIEIKRMIEDGDEYNSTIDYIRRNGRSISTGGEYPTWAFIYMIHSATFFIEKEKDHGYLDEMVRKNTNKETSYIKGRLVQYDKINFIFLYNYQMGEIWHHVNQTLAQEIKDYVQRYTKMTVDCVVDEDKKLIVEKKDWDMKYQNDLFEAECFMKIQEEEKLGKAQVFEYNLERVSPTKWSLLKEGKVIGEFPTLKECKSQACGLHRLEKRLEWEKVVELNEATWQQKLGAGAVALGLATGAPNIANAQHLTRGMRDNNPTNVHHVIDKHGNSWKGEISKDKDGESDFDSVQDGFRAGVVNFLTHKKRSPHLTVKEYLRSFANTATSKQFHAYTTNLSRFGIDINAKISAIDPIKFVVAQSKAESGMVISPEVQQKVRLGLGLK